MPVSGNRPIHDRRKDYPVGDISQKSVGDSKGKNMSTVTKKELVDRIAEVLGVKRVIVKRVTQQFLDEIIAELGKGNRLEFRDFGVFESKQRAARVAQNPKTMERVPVPSKRTVKFKVGRMMKIKLQEIAKAHAAHAARDGQAAPVAVAQAAPAKA